METNASLESLRPAIEATPAGMIIVNRAGEIMMVNARVEQLFGYRPDEVLGRSLEMLVPQRLREHHPGYRASFNDSPRTRPMGAGRELYGLHKDGSEVPVEIGLNPLTIGGGEYVLGSVVDITERRRAERERDVLLEQLRDVNQQLEERVRTRTRELEEREAMLQEIHHRVKNNLQVISSLINLQTRKVSDPSSRVALEECQGRVQAIAMIHEKLYQSNNYAQVPFSDYARSLAESVVYSRGQTEGTTLTLALQPVPLAIDKAIPCGLVLNELITNALKHAFVDGRRGEITIEFCSAGLGKVRLAVHDNGVGLPLTPAPDKPSLGLRLVDTLSRQLSAEVEIGRAGGTHYQLTFPVESGL